ncbi:MAG: acyl carrier protein [Acidobacteria bacterium]|nr:acyl carrier protein [Acidobacteriota bacterium]
MESSTRSYVRAKTLEIVCDQLVVSTDEVSESSDIVRELGADSLDVTALIMRFEREFDLSINSATIEAEIETVGDAIRIVTNFLLMSERYASCPEQGADAPRLPRPLDAPPLSSRPHRAKASDGAKAAYLTGEEVARSALFKGYFRDLGLDAGEMTRFFRAAVGRNYIYHVTPIAEKNDDDSLKLVDIFLLGRSNIYHFLLQRGPVWFEWSPLSELIITYEILFDDAKKISAVKVTSRSRDAHGVSKQSLRNTELYFSRRQVRGALKFLSKFVSYTETER